MCAGNCGCGSNCNCLTLPQAIGPKGDTGASGINGLDAGNVIDTITYNPAFGGPSPFVAGVDVGNFTPYEPAIDIRIPENFEILHDRLKIRALFHVDDDTYPTEVSMGVCIDEGNFLGIQANFLTTLEIDSATMSKNTFFYMEFYMSLQDIPQPQQNISFNVIGHAKFSKDSVDLGSKNMFLNDNFEHYVIFGPDQRSNVDASDNFKIRLFKSKDSPGITPRYFSIEYCKKERP
jgi:hypothetical protein